MLETIYRQIASHRLTRAQFKDKLQKDSEYKIAVDNLTVSYKKGEITQEAYNQQKSILWHTYKDWAISQGLYQEVTSAQQLAEAEDGLNTQVEEVNTIRTELGLKAIQITEAVVL